MMSSDLDFLLLHKIKQEKHVFFSQIKTAFHTSAFTQHCLKLRGFFLPSANPRFHLLHLKRGAF